MVSGAKLRNGKIPTSAMNMLNKDAIMKTIPLDHIRGDLRYAVVTGFVPHSCNISDTATTTTGSTSVLDTPSEPPSAKRHKPGRSMSSDQLACALGREYRMSDAWSFQELKRRETTHPPTTPTTHTTHTTHKTTCLHLPCVTLLADIAKGCGRGTSS